MWGNRFVHEHVMGFVIEEHPQHAQEPGLNEQTGLWLRRKEMNFATMNDSTAHLADLYNAVFALIAEVSACSVPFPA